jgi:hypothetical protein
MTRSYRIPLSQDVKKVSVTEGVGPDHQLPELVLERAGLQGRRGATGILGLKA